MKKISIKNVKETLSRKEMRTISGGYGAFCTTNLNCHAYYGANNFLCINMVCYRHN